MKWIKSNRYGCSNIIGQNLTKNRPTEWWKKKKDSHTQFLFIKVQRWTWIKSIRFCAQYWHNCVYCVFCFSYICRSNMYIETSFRLKHLSWMISATLSAIKICNYFELWLLWFVKTFFKIGKIFWFTNTLHLVLWTSWFYRLCRNSVDPAG